MSSAPVTIRPVVTKKDRKAFVDFAWEVYKDDPAWVPPLKDEVHGLITPGKNPWFEHARAQLWLAERGGKVVGRISAQVDDLVQEHMGAGMGQWGMFEALDGEAAAALIATAEDWLRNDGMTSVLGPISLSIWDEPGLEIEGFAEPPTAMMGHHRPEYRAWIEAAGYAKAKDLLTYEVDIAHWDDPKINRLIAMGDGDPVAIGLSAVGGLGSAAEVEQQPHLDLDGLGVLILAGRGDALDLDARHSLNGSRHGLDEIAFDRIASHLAHQFRVVKAKSR